MQISPQRTAPPGNPNLPATGPKDRAPGRAACRPSSRPPFRPTGGIAARVAGMRAGGMSQRAIRRALGLSEAEALASGLVDPVLLPAAGPNETSRPHDPRGPSLMAVADAVARACDLPRPRLFGAAQDRGTARARHLLMFLLRELCAGASFPTIGFFLNRDHTTVIYGVRRIARDLERDAALRALHARLRRELGASR